MKVDSLKARRFFFPEQRTRLFTAGTAWYTAVRPGNNQQLLNGGTALNKVSRISIKVGALMCNMLPDDNYAETMLPLENTLFLMMVRLYCTDLYG